MKRVVRVEKELAIDATPFEKMYNSANLIQGKLYHLIQSLSSTLDRQKV